MAEYVTVMLANSKSSVQITAELSDLIGTDFEHAFTDWIFDSAIPEFYGSGTPKSAAAKILAASPAGPASAPSQSERQPQIQLDQGTSIQTVQDSREYNSNRGTFGSGDQRGRMRGFNDAGLPQRPRIPTGPRGPGGNQRGSGGNGVFGTAMASLKREGEAFDRPSRRPRLSGENGYENAGEDGPRKTMSIFDRAGVRAGTAAPNNFHNMGGSGHNGRTSNGSFPGGPAMPASVQAFPQIPGLPPLHIPDNFSSLHSSQQQAIQQQIFQHQLIAAAAAQQLYTPSNVASPPPPISAEAIPFIAPLDIQQPTFHASLQPGSAIDGTRPRKTSKPVQLPPIPASEELCKYGVDCKNAICKYSHPSPAATKESGLVLTREVCPKGIDCGDMVDIALVSYSRLSRKSVMLTYLY